VKTSELCIKGRKRELAVGEWPRAHEQPFTKRVSTRKFVQGGGGIRTEDPSGQKLRGTPELLCLNSSEAREKGNFRGRPWSLQKKSRDERKITAATRSRRPIDQGKKQQKYIDGKGTQNKLREQQKLYSQMAASF